MKNKYCAILLAVAALLSACKKDSESPKAADGQSNLNTTSATGTQSAANASGLSYMRLQLEKDSINTDETLIDFKANAQTIYVRDEDASYLKGFGLVSLWSLSSDNVPLSINSLPLPKPSITINLAVHSKSTGIYKLNLTVLQSIPAIFEIWLMDKYKKDSLDLRSNKTYAFNLNLADTGTYGSHRFSLVIRQNAALGIHLLNFTANKTTGGTQLNWQTENEETYTTFNIERSTDNGTSYTSIAGSASTAASFYSYTDKTLAKGANLYRLKITDLNGTITYSKSLTINY